MQRQKEARYSVGMQCEPSPWHCFLQLKGHRIVLADFRLEGDSPYLGSNPWEAWKHKPRAG